MPRQGRMRNAWIVRGAVACGLFASLAATAQEQSADQPRTSAQSAGVSCPVESIEQMVRLSTCELDRLYQQSSAGTIPRGKVRGRAILFPGKKLAGPASKAARLFWQGKVFDPCQSGAVNRFFGLKVIRGNVGYGESWMDGRSSIILDYQDTSLIYARNRDEIRQVGPCLYLGIMYERTCPQPTLKMYFALESQPQCD